MDPVRHLFLETLAKNRPLVASPEVGARWNEPSALPDFPVRGLAGHLVRAAVTVDSYLDRPEPQGGEPISAASYFANLDSDIASPLNVGVRARGEEQAAGGHEALVAEFDRLSSRLEERLPREPDDRLVTVAGDAIMRLDEYLVTRLVELTIHADGLAVSVGLDCPSLPSGALDITLAALLSVARHRHGDLAVLRALSRRERTSGTVLPVF
jgi:hypothetical protein